MNAYERGYQANLDGYLQSDNPLVGMSGEGAWMAGWDEAQRTLRDPWESANYERCSAL